MVVCAGSQAKVFMEALRMDPKSSNAIMCMATTLAAGEQFSLDGRVMSQQDMFLEALRVKPDNSLAMVHIANTMWFWEKVTLPDGRVLGKSELLALSGRVDVHDSCTIM